MDGKGYTNLKWNKEMYGYKKTPNFQVSSKFYAYI